MRNEHPNSVPGDGPPGAGAQNGRSPALTRRQALGRITAVAGAGAAAWVVPEILTAKPAGGAALSAVPLIGSGGGGGTGGGGGGGTGPATSPATTGGSSTVQAATTGGTSGSGVPTSPASPQLAATGLEVGRDAEIGVAMIAGGWALQRWASRTPKAALANAGDHGEAGSPADPT